MSDPRLILHIDRLVLRGIDPLNHQAFIEGLKTELAFVLSDSETRGMITQSRSTPVKRLGRIPMESGLAGARKLGGGVARAIGKGLKP